MSGGGFSLPPINGQTEQNTFSDGTFGSGDVFFAVGDQAAARLFPASAAVSPVSRAGGFSADLSPLILVAGAVGLVLLLRRRK